MHIYLPNDYDAHTELSALVSDKFKFTETAEYPTSPAGLEYAAILAVADMPPTPELDDKPINSTTLPLPATLIP
jgi:hypothetical protein